MIKFKTNGILILFLLVALPKRTFAFWVVNFGTARTLAPHRFGFGAGMGAQLVFLGSPQKTSGFFTIPHAGFRLGLAKGIDCGLRLAPIPLPFSSVGPGFGVNLDAKVCFTKPERKVQVALVPGAGGAHVLIQDQTRLAYSLNIAALTSFHLNDKLTFTAMGRFVNLVIPTAKGAEAGNYANISGISVGLRKKITDSISIFSEVGAYWNDGKLANVVTSGPGFQVGLMISTSF